MDKHVKELTVIALSCMPKELQLGNIAVRTRTTHITDIAEATADIDICPCVRALVWFAADEKEWHGIHEVRSVGTLEKAEQHTVGT